MASHTRIQYEMSKPQAVVRTAEETKTLKKETDEKVAQMRMPKPAESPAEKDDWFTVMLIRVLYVTFYMAEGVLQPYLPMYYESLGYGGQIVGLLGSITPAVTFLVGPFWGVVSDSMQAPFAILYTTIAITLLGKLLVGAVNDPYVVMAIVCIKSIFGAPIKPLIDSVVLHQLHDRSQYGRMRLWALVGTGIGTSMGGYFIDDSPAKAFQWGQITSPVEMFRAFYASLSGFRLLFFVDIALHIPLFLAMRSFQVDHKKHGLIDAANNKESTVKPKTKQLSPKEVILSLAKNTEAVVFFTVVYVMGISGGIADNFTYTRFREIGCSGATMGNSRLTSSGAGAIMFWYAGALTSILGTNAVLLISLFAASLRFGLYAIMDKCIYAHIGEAVRGLTFGSFWSTATVYASELAPEGAQATMLLLLNGSYNGIGRSTGAIIGGKLQAAVGTAKMFHYVSAVCFALGCIFALYKFLSRTTLRIHSEKKIQ